MLNIISTFNKYFKENGKVMAFIAIIDAVTSQIYLAHFYNGFRISISVLILPVFYYFYKNIHPVIMALWIGLFGLVFRGLIGFGAFGGFLNAVLADFQIFYFDIMYGILFFLLFYLSEEKSLSKWVLVVWFCDFSANFVEIVARFGYKFAFQMSILDSLFTVALIRTVIATGIVFLLRYYKVILIKEQSFEKYKVMYSVMADLKSEVYYMQENMDHIEDVMSDAYHLYEHLATAEDESLRQTSLRIAKDVHEIKKNYIKVADGISRIGIDQNMSQHLLLNELLDLLDDYFKRDSQLTQIQFKIERSIHSKIQIKEHFLMMSVLRNLVMNAFEALNQSANPQAGLILLKVTDKENTLYLEVTDNGVGIKEKDLAFIFNPGYSTKFNPETGDIYRGLGLTLVKDIVESNFHGNISIHSNPQQGTTFKIQIPIQYLGD